jgi:hypothetical protein
LGGTFASGKSGCTLGTSSLRTMPFPELQLGHRGGIASSGLTIPHFRHSNMLSEAISFSFFLLLRGAL